MKLKIVLSERLGCHAALHVSDSQKIFAGIQSRHFCRALRVTKDRSGSCFVGWTGDAALEPGVLELSKPFADILKLADGDIAEVQAEKSAPVATAVMVQPNSIDDWEVVELQASFIEESLLSQIAVLSPGMSFPIWIHGQMAAKLKVDARDDNKTECFLLGRDTELMIESQKRAAAEQAQTIFGPGRDFEEQHLTLRVLGMDKELDTPAVKVNTEDLEDLAGYLAMEGCLVWLSFRRGGGGGGEGDDVKQQLVRATTDNQIPVGQIVLGACFAEHAEVPRFGLVHLARCRQVPVFVPTLELQPLGPWGRGHNQDNNFLAQDARWVEERFQDLLDQIGQLDLMEGAVVQLRNKDSAPKAGISATQRFPPKKIADSQHGTPGPGIFGGASDSTDLYDGLSDISDLYNAPPEKPDAPALNIVASRSGIVELDFGLDQDDDNGPDLSQSWEWFETAEARPPTVAVRVNFALGAARAALRGDAVQPPFVHLTPRTLKEDVRVDVCWPGEEAFGESGTSSSSSSSSSSHELAALWASTPGLEELPSEYVDSEALRLFCSSSPSSSSSSSSGGGTSSSSSSSSGSSAAAFSGALDELLLFSEPTESLRGSLLAQLGCLQEEAIAGKEPRRPHPCSPNMPSHSTPGAVALLGSTGTGKTCLCRRVLSELSVKGVLAIEVSCTKLGAPSRKFKALQQLLKDLLRVAARHAPSAVFLDDFGALCPDVEPGAPNLSVVEERSPILTELLLDLLPSLRATGAQVALCVTLPSDAAVHRALWNPAALEHKITLRGPLVKERPQILQLLLKSRQSNGSAVDEELLHEGALDNWSGKVDGYSIADLCGLVQRSGVEAEIQAGENLLATSNEGTAFETDPKVTLQHLEKASGGFVPASMANQSFLTSETQISDVGGLAEAKQELMDMLTMPTKYAVLMDRAPVRTRKGMMLVGPPGCGKTFLVQAAANETKGLLRFLSVKGPELLSKYIGESEAGVRRVFERAAAAAPAVIFFDEIEALAPKRGADSTGVTDRVVNQMLTYLDGVEDRGRVYVLAASGRPDLVDPALMRPGRFDRICYCGLPTDAEKLEICEILAQKNGLAVGAETSIREELSKLVEKIPKLFTSADLTGLFSSAKIEAVNEALAKPSHQPDGKPATPVMSMEHLFVALSEAKASVSQADMDKYNKVFEPYMPSKKESAIERTAPATVPVANRVALA